MVNIMKKIGEFVAFVPLALCAMLFSSCGRQRNNLSLEEVEVFSLEYGNFEDELNIFDYNQIGNIDTRIAMRNGFFYISNGESQKIMEMNSYGDLLTLFYNEDTNPRPSFATEEGETMNATRKAVSYPFNRVTELTVDGRKYIYAVDQLPLERQEYDDELQEHLENIVVRFDGEGKFVDYLGQQGPGGTPFPFVKNIYVTNNNELVVVCVSSEGPIVYWFSEAGHMLFTIPIEKKNVPSPYEEDQEFYVEIENVVPDYNDRILYVKLDYSIPYVDEASRMQSGVDYDRTTLYGLNVETGTYGAPMNIIPYTEVSVDDFSNLEYKIPYDFLGVSENGWFFFIISNDAGFGLQIIQANGQRILNRQLEMDRQKTLFYTFNLSNSGILSVLSIRSDKAYVNWWRTDSLIQSITNN